MHTFVERLRNKGIEISNHYAFDSFRSDSLSICMARWECPVQDVIDQNGHQQGVGPGDGTGLSGGHHAGVDAHQQDNGGQQSRWP